jgi:hypothetical protein
MKTGSIPVPASNNFNRLERILPQKPEAVSDSVSGFPFWSRSVPVASVPTMEGSNGPVTTGAHGANTLMQGSL